MRETNEMRKTILLVMVAGWLVSLAPISEGAVRRHAAKHAPAGANNARVRAPHHRHHHHSGHHPAAKVHPMKQ